MSGLFDRAEDFSEEEDGGESFKEELKDLGPTGAVTACGRKGALLVPSRDCIHSMDLQIIS